MRRSCSLELCLSQPEPSDCLASFESKDVHDISNQTKSAVAGADLKPPVPSPSPSPQQLTIFYKGRVCVCDVTELQAKAILWQASRESQEIRRIKSSSWPLDPISPNSPSQLCAPNLPSSTSTQSLSSSSSSYSGVSMRRSLERFLEKRKNRIISTSPYHYTSKF